MLNLKLCFLKYVPQIYLLEKQENKMCYVVKYTVTYFIK